MRVAIIGRPNVGKSTLFNRIIGGRKALVHSVPGTTRDRNEVPVLWNGKEFYLIDTGGWEKAKNEIGKETIKQMQKALESADLIMLVVDGKEGFHPVDGDIARILRKSSKPSILTVNKIDSSTDEIKINDFYVLGIDNTIAVSASHGRNINELLDKIAEFTMDSPQEIKPPAENVIRVVIVGKPNTGKSSLANKLLNEERLIVNDAPGTTREAIDLQFSRGTTDFILIDTPGLHRKHNFTDDMEYLGTLSARKAIERSNLAILLMDATQKIGETEARIAEIILENKCACLIVINKWDLVENREEAVKIVKAQLEEKLPFLWWSKIVFISAKTGQRTDKVLDEAETIFKNYSKIIDAKELKETVLSASQRIPLSRHGTVLKIKSCVQDNIHPPSFTMGVNSTATLHFSYKRYLENVLREKFDLTGTPINMRFRKG